MKQKNFWFISLIILVVLIAYSNTYHCSFHFDDKLSIVENPVIKNLSNFNPIINHKIIKNTRYIGLLSFAINYKINGLNVTGYHIVNNLIHIINAIMVYLLVLLFFKIPLINNSKLTNEKELIALFTSLVFASHPIQTQAVTYIAQRYASLAALFYLLTVFLYLKARTMMESKSKGASFFYLLSILTAVLAMKTKEISFTLPFIIAILDFILFRNTSLKKRSILLLPLMLTALIIPLSLLNIDKPIGEVLSDVSEKTKVQTSISRFEYFFTELRVIVTYIRLLFLPIGQNLDYDYPIYRTFFAPSVFLSFLLLAGLFTMALYLSITAPKRDGAFLLTGIGILWFFVTLSVESSFIPIVDVIFEHRVYLPSFGAFLALVTLVFLLLKKFSIKKKIIVSIWIVVILSLSGITLARNRVWKNEITLWTDVVKKSPNKARGYNGLGFALKERGEIDSAIVYFKKAIQLEPAYARARNNLANAYFEKGLTQKAIKEFENLLKLYKNYAEAYYNLGVIYERLGNQKLAENLYRTALNYKPSYPEAHNNLGLLLKRQGRYNEAIKHLYSAVTLKPEFADAHYNL